MTLKLFKFTRQAKEHKKSSPSDYDVIEEILAGDIDRYAVIMRRYNQRLFRIARSILLDEQRAMDAVQNAHIKAYQNLPGFHGERGFSTWISVIARNEALMIRRKYHAEKFEQLDSHSQQAGNVISADARPSAPAKPEELMENNQLRRLLNSHIDNLPEKFRTVFIMRCVEELSVKETAAILELNPATVKTRVFRAKSLLQESITRQHRSSAYEFGGSHCDEIVRRVLAEIRRMSD